MLQHWSDDPKRYDYERYAYEPEPCRRCTAIAVFALLAAGSVLTLALLILGGLIDSSRIRHSVEFIAVVFITVLTIINLVKGRS